MTIAIRFATARDAATLHRFVVELATYEREPDAVKATPADFAAQLDDPDPPFECLLAEEDGVAVGFALFFRNYSTWTGRPGIHLEDLYVVPEVRGRGVGAALLTRCAAIAEERGFARLEWSVLDWNEPAIAFYRRLGAKPQSEWTTYRVTGEALAALAKGGPT